MTKQKINKQAFTLVELIVVITILAILWTIAFISLAWYSQDARDSTRISDLSTMKTSLELFHLNAWKYPLTTSWFDVVYSWAIVWSQWTFWTTTKLNVEKLDKIPTDPLTEKEYTYSTTKTKQEYQLSWIFESDDFAWLGILNNTYAWDTITSAVVTWNYNGKVLKSLTWSECELLSLPSIISSQPETITELTDILTASWLVYNWYNNLPSNYRSSKYNADWWFAYTSNKLVVYSDSDSCNDVYDPDDNAARNELITNLQTAYSGTILEAKDGIKDFVNIDLTDKVALDSVWSYIVTNNLWWEIIAWKAWTSVSINFDVEWNYVQENSSWTDFSTWKVLLSSSIPSTPVPTSKIASISSMTPAWWTVSISDSTHIQANHYDGSSFEITFTEPVSIKATTHLNGFQWWWYTPWVWTNHFKYWDGSIWVTEVSNTNDSFWVYNWLGIDITSTKINIWSRTPNNWFYNVSFELLWENWASFYVTTTDSSQLDVSSATLIWPVSFTSTKPATTDLKYLVSFDWRSTWKYWDWSAWQTSVLWDISANWMSETVLWWLNSSNFWATWWFEAWTTTTLDFAVNLESTSWATPELDKIKVFVK